MSRRRSYKPKPGKRKKTVRRIAGRYDHKNWRKFRQVYIQDNPYCVVCGADCVAERWAGNVDHIIPHEYGGAWYSEVNVQTLCTVDHGLKSRLEQMKGGPLVAWRYNKEGDKIPQDRSDIVRLLREKQGISGKPTGRLSSREGGI